MVALVRRLEYGTIVLLEKVMAEMDDCDSVVVAWRYGH
jgi:hypothetical protein